MSDNDDFNSPVRNAPSADSEAALIVDLEGFEGPLDLLLMLARTQKVDLRKISVLKLADQYLAFIQDARKLELDIAADYLVMAAWLAYLKSRLLLPDENAAPGQPTGEELAARLAFRLQRLEAMREAAARLFARDRLGRDVFARGAPEGVRLVKTPVYGDNIYDFLKAYAEQRTRRQFSTLRIPRAPIFPIEDARRRLERMLGVIVDWQALDALIPEEFRFGERRRSAIASTLSATLEMVRDGHLEMRQTAPFGPIYLKAKTPLRASNEA